MGVFFVAKLNDFDTLRNLRLRSSLLSSTLVVVVVVAVPGVLDGEIGLDTAATGPFHAAVPLLIEPLNFVFLHADIFDVLVALSGKSITRLVHHVAPLIDVSSEPHPLLACVRVLISALLLPDAVSANPNVLRALDDVRTTTAAVRDRCGREGH